MKLKPLAGLVCLAQIAQIGLGLSNALTHHYFSAQYCVQLVLSVPLVLFFFYIWRNQKT